MLDGASRGERGGAGVAAAERDGAASGEEAPGAVDHSDAGAAGGECGARDCGRTGRSRSSGEAGWRMARKNRYSGRVEAAAGGKGQSGGLAGADLRH